MDERLTAIEELADLYQKRFESASKTVADLRNAVHSMFQKFGCSTSVVRELLGDGGVTDRNMLQHLSVIEQRVNEILRVYGGSLTQLGADMEHLKVCHLLRIQITSCSGIAQLPLCTGLQQQPPPPKSVAHPATVSVLLDSCCYLTCRYHWARQRCQLTGQRW